MGGYGREAVEDYDDYDMEGEYQDEYAEEEEGEEEEGEQEYEEEEARQPTQEEMEYLELRQKLKDSIRRKRKQSGAGSSQEKEKRLPYDNFGSFFGPSQPVIAQRVIQESKSLLENQHLVTKMLSANNKKNSASNSAGQKLVQRGPAPKATSELRKKVEKLKSARDYSFLSDDAEAPAPAKEPPARNISVPTSEARSAQMLPKSKQQLVSNGNSGRNVQGIREERKAVSMNGQMHSKVGSHKSSASKPNVMSMDSKKHLGVNNGSGPGRPIGVSNGSGPGRPVGVSNGSGPGRPVGVSNGSGPGRPVGVSNASGPGRPVGVSNASGPCRPLGNGSGAGRSVAVSNGIGPGRPTGSKAVPPRMPVAMAERKISAPVARNLPASSQKAPPPKMHSSDSKQHLEMKKRLQERSKDKIMPRRPAISSKPEVNKPVKRVSSHSHTASHVQGPRKKGLSEDEKALMPKKKGLSEDEKALMMIRNMFRTDRYPVCEEDDDSDMEANFDDIMKEEKRSARIARQEDEEQLRLIEEEERQERMRRLAKKRKLSQH